MSFSRACGHVLKGLICPKKTKISIMKKNRRQQHMLTFSEMKADTVWYFCSMKHLQSKNTRRRSIFMPSLLSLLTTSDTWTPPLRRLATAADLPPLRPALRRTERFLKGFLFSSQFFRYIKLNLFSFSPASPVCTFKHISCILLVMTQ